MSWWRGVFRLWVGVAVIAVALLLFGSLSSIVNAPQTNDASEFLLAAVFIAAGGLFGMWVLIGMRPSR